jgi:hypothetical protein
VSKKVPDPATPAEAVAQKATKALDSSFRRNDETQLTRAFWTPFQGSHWGALQMAAGKSGSTQYNSRAFAARFSALEGSFSRLLEENMSFATLCQEHSACAAALAFWKQSTAEEAPRFRSEYAVLLLELEAEIQYYLEHHERCAEQEQTE